jgi:CDP-glucose 4,6-dehydratase
MRRFRSVLVTGHTGFKGGWLSLWLAHRGAAVHGYAAAAPTRPSFFEVADVGSRLASHTIGDIRDRAKLARTLAAARPEVVFHLAAQPLVRQSYRDPLETFDVNVMGTAHLLDAVRTVDSVRAVVVVTTDKCYENVAWDWPYREQDRLGGHDPYSASKACAELVAQAYSRSFLAEAGIAVATARAGNVIGGGDWAADRLIPDLLDAIDAGRAPVIRSPEAVRPWQHVLEPLTGYMMLAERLLDSGKDFAAAWNFGPDESAMRSVRWIAERLCRQPDGPGWRHEATSGAHEAQTLRLDSSKARHRLGWRSRWSLDEALSHTLDWHRSWRRGNDMAAVSLAQIEAYEERGATPELAQAS